jgi:hypothetical protein
MLAVYYYDAWLILNWNKCVEVNKEKWKGFVRKYFAKIRVRGISSCVNENEGKNGICIWFYWHSERCDKYIKFLEVLAFCGFDSYHTELLNTTACVQNHNCQSC